MIVDLCASAEDAIAIADTKCPGWSWKNDSKSDGNGWQLNCWPG